MTHRNAIFISYRRDESDGYARYLHRDLMQWFDADVVYFDRQSPAPGTEFSADITDAIEREARVVVVLIGKLWLGEMINRAKHGETDLVRLEIQHALARRQRDGLPIFPVLIGASALPKSVDAPQDIAALVDTLRGLQNLELFQGSAESASQQFDRFLKSLASIPGVPAPAARYPQGYEPPFSIGHVDAATVFVDTDRYLAALETRLAPAEACDSVTKLTLCGMAGVGKSELARQFSLKHRKAFGGGVWWLQADDAGTLQAAVEDACRASLIPLRPDDDACQLWRGWLERSLLPWLIVIDNVESADIDLGMLPRFGPHRILITSRDVAWDHALKLEPWGQDAAAFFLQTQLIGHPFPGEARHLHRLCDALGGNPLALAHALAYLRATDCPVEDYVVALEDVDRAPALLASTGRRASAHPVLATLRSALARCQPAARCLLETLACFAVEPVPERWLRAQFGGSCATGETVHDDIQWNELVAQLRSFALVSRVGTYPHRKLLGATSDLRRSQPCLQLNRLTQQSLLAILPSESATRRASTVLLAVAARTEMLTPGRTVEYACLLPHLVFRGTLDRDAEAARLLREMAELHRAKGDLTAAYQCLQLWHQRSADLLGSDAAETVESEVLLAETYADLGQPDEAMQAACLAAQHAQRLTSPLGLLTRARALEARCWALKGQPDKALVIYEAQLVDAYLQTDKPAPQITPWLIQALRDMGATLRLAGQITRAFHVLCEVLELAESNLGAGHASTIDCADALAATRQDLGQLEPASRLWQFVVQTRIELSGTLHPMTIDAQCSLAEVMRRQGQFDRAIAVYECAISAANLTLAHDDTRLQVLRDGLKLALDHCDAPAQTRRL